MKAGFWVAPEGADEAMTVLPIGGIEAAPGRRKMSCSPPARARRCPSLPARAQNAARNRRRARRRRPRTRRASCSTSRSFPTTKSACCRKPSARARSRGVVALPDGVVAQIQEAMHGRPVARALHRCRGQAVRRLSRSLQPAGNRAARRAGQLPALVFGAAAGRRDERHAAAGGNPARARRRTSAGEPTHTITFSLLPMTPEDMSFLQQTPRAPARCS